MMQKHHTPLAVLVTGASSGIGRATVLACAAKGWRVAAGMRNPEDAGELATTPGVTVLPFDVADPKSVASGVNAAGQICQRLDAVVNNAGYSLDGVFETMTDELIRQQFETNVFGLMRVTRAVIPMMRQQGGGTIVQVSSMGGRVTFPFYSIYHASKWAVEGFSESLAYELRSFGIRMRLIEPGVIRTHFYGRSRQRPPQPADDSYLAISKRCDAISLTAAERSGAEPGVVAEAIVRAISDRGWKLRYPVAAPAPFLLQLRKLLPDPLFFWLIRRRYHIR